MSGIIHGTQTQVAKSLHDLARGVGSELNQEFSHLDMTVLEKPFAGPVWMYNADAHGFFIYCADKGVLHSQEVANDGASIDVDSTRKAIRNAIVAIQKRLTK
jgi:hypothetical protein